MRSLSIFYILVLYVIMQFCWWAYLLIRLNDEVYSLRVENLYYKGYTSQIYEQKQTELQKKLKTRWMMIAGEGFVFVCLLSLGIYQTRSSFKKEVALNRQQQNFLLAITHEFKSPLASVKLYLQTLQMRQLDREKQLEFIANAVEEAERLDKLVENSLMATRMENHSYVFNLQKRDLSELSMSILAGRSFRNPIRQEIEANVQASVDELAYASLLYNLIENAQKYSSAEDEIFVSLESDNKNVVLRVADQGIGIPDSEKKAVFSKFYRVGNELTRKTKGTGLGLYIVKNIVEGHHGKIAILNNTPKGSIFELRLPV